MARKRAAPPKEPPPPEAGPLRHAALAGLKTLRDALPSEAPSKPLPPPPKKPAPPSAGPWRPDREKELFNAAMSGVVPLGPDVRGARRGAATPRDRDLAAKLRRAQAEGDEGLVVRWSENGTCEAARRGHSFALAALQRFIAPDASLDLHGLDAVEATLRVAEFVRSRRARGVRVVSVVHGVGRHAADGDTVLRDAAVRALSEPPGSRHVNAFCSTASGGAIAVALRER